MCGRFSLGTIAETIQKIYGDELNLSLTPRYNISPGQQILAIKSDGHTPSVETMLWGLIPSWANDRSIGYKMINARGETVADKPSFRSAFQSRRCLIPADGFYEWVKQGKGKQPYYFCQVDKAPFSFAGIWESWTDDETGEHIDSCSIITTAANKLVEPVHHRMPVIIQPESYDAWLHGSSSNQRQLIEPYEWPSFKVYPVSTYVNNARNEGPECIEPLL